LSSISVSFVRISYKIKKKTEIYMKKYIWSEYHKENIMNHDL
jgi:hypothetical protein